MKKQSGKLKKEHSVKMKEVTDQLSSCRDEIKLYVENNTKLKEEIKVLKGIKEAQEEIDKESDPEVVEIEEDDSDISNEELADVYLRNKNDTGTKPKNKLKCISCAFEAKDEKLLRGHMSLHRPGNGNYEGGVLSYKDGYSCNRCSESFKTMGLIKRHMKTKHGITITASPPDVDGAKSHPKDKVWIKCDRCNYKAETKEDLIKHLDAYHVTKQVRCNICQMMADSNAHLKDHMENQHNSRNNRTWRENFHKQKQKPTNQKPVCKFWLKGNCFHGQDCRFSHTNFDNNTILCRDGDYCLFWPNCKYTHVEMCRYQENCLRQNCPFVHGNANFLESGQNMPAPNINSQQDFPPFPQQHWRPW